jgi:hypothetical protein
MGDRFPRQWARVHFYTYHETTGHYITLSSGGLAGVILRSVLVMRQVVFFGGEWLWFSVPFGTA